MSSITINYAALFGIHSIAAAAIFTIIYVPLAVYYIQRTLTRFNYVFVFLMGFCLSGSCILFFELIDVDVCIHFQLFGVCEMTTFIAMIQFELQGLLFVLR